MSESNQQGGVSLVGVLTIIFVTLKLLGVDPVAAWSWWWVLSPIWIVFVVGLVLVVIVSLLESRAWKTDE